MVAKKGLSGVSARSFHGLHALPAAGRERVNEKGHIVIVDSSANSRMEMRIMLEQLGYEVSEAATTGEALLNLADRAPELVLVDLKTPELGGPGLCSVLRSYHRTRAIPVFLVASARDADKEAI